jgi:hypothetical protein
VFGLQRNADRRGGLDEDDITFAIPEEAPAPAFDVFTRSDMFGDLDDVLFGIGLEFAVPFQRLDDSSHLALQEFGTNRGSLFNAMLLLVELPPQALDDEPPSILLPTPTGAE